MKVQALLMLVLFAGAAVDAFAMRCGDRLVSLDDTKAEVLGKCGEPAFADVVAIETSTGIGSGALALDVPVEQWTYNQGPNTLLKILTFKGGVVVSIGDGERVPSNSGEKQIYAASLNDSQADVLQKWGEPLFRDVVGTEPIESLAIDGRTVVREGKIERWAYSLGPGTFLKLLTFKDGRLAKIEEGDRQ